MKETRFYRCARCRRLFEIVPDDSFSSVKPDGPNRVSFHYQADQYGKVKFYEGEWCNECTSRDLRPLTEALPLPAK